MYISFYKVFIYILLMYLVICYVGGVLFYPILEVRIHCLLTTK